jgi:hypothetical protein
MKKNDVQSLSAIYYRLVGIDHHKDRDCHFYLNEVFSYGQEPYFRVEHYGYISDLPDEISEARFSTRDEAYVALRDWLQITISDLLADYQELNPDLDFNVAAAHRCADEFSMYIEPSPDKT